MHIYVKILKGDLTEVAVSPSHTVSQVKEILEMQFGVPAPEQSLVCKGKTLLDTKKLSDYNIHDGEKFYLFQKKPENSSDVKTTASPGVAHAPPQSDASSPSIESTSVNHSGTSTAVVWEKLRLFLHRHFTKHDTEKVLAAFQKEFYDYIESLSLDDIERLAIRKLEQAPAENGFQAT